MKVFVNYIKDILSRDENAVFLLNRFHLSVYVMSVLRKPILVREYDEIISSLRTLRVHVFILQLDESEIEKRSLHPERSGRVAEISTSDSEERGFPRQVGTISLATTLDVRRSGKTADTLLYIKVVLCARNRRRMGSCRSSSKHYRRGVRMNPADTRTVPEVPETLTKKLSVSWKLRITPLGVSTGHRENNDRY